MTGGLAKTLLLLPVIAMLTGCGGGNSDVSTLFGNKPITYGSLSLSWVAPVSRVDGSSISISEIGGYRIRYGTQPNLLDNIIDIRGSSVTNYQARIPTGQNYLAVSAYDTDGVEGPKSTMIARTVN